MASLTVILRRWAAWGARTGPGWFLKHSPGPIGIVASWIARKQRRRVAALQRWIAGDAGRLTEVFTNYAHCLAESLALGREPSLEIVGAGHLDASQPGPRIILTAHTGAWELAAGAMARQFGAPVQLVLEPEAAPELWQLHEGLRAERGLSGIRAEAGPDAALKALNSVQAGAWLALQVDRPGPSGRALRVRLFGRSFPMPEGPFRIAKVTGAPLVAVFNARVGFMRYRIEVFPPIRLARDASPSDLVQAAQAVADCLQQFVARHPTQWFHFSDPPSADAD